MHNDPAIKKIEDDIFLKRTAMVNQMSGMVLFAIDLAILGTDAPRTFAIVTFVYVIPLLAIIDSPYKRIYKLWRETGAKYIQLRFVWKHLFPSFFSLAFLFLIAIGQIDKSGFAIFLKLKTFFTEGT